MASLKLFSVSLSCCSVGCFVGTPCWG